MHWVELEWLDRTRSHLIDDSTIINVLFITRSPVGVVVVGGEEDRGAVLLDDVEEEGTAVDAAEVFVAMVRMI